jgi:hypothetical protein
VEDKYEVNWDDEEEEVEEEDGGNKWDRLSLSSTKEISKLKI